MSENNYPSDVEIIENFSLEGYQVVRGEFFSHIFEPSLTFSGNKVYVNMTCIKKLPNYDYIQFLINAQKKSVAIRPCPEEMRDSVRWSTASSKRGPKQITARMFCAKIYALMNWNPSYRYKLLGKLISAGGELLFIYDLNTPEIYPIRKKDDDTSVEKSRIPMYPEEWKDQFGIPVEEHQKITQISIFDNYAVFSMENPVRKEAADGGQTASVDRHEMEQDPYSQENPSHDW